MKLKTIHKSTSHQGRFVPGIRNLFCAIAGALVISACSSTQHEEPAVMVLEPVDGICQQSALKMQASAENSGIKAQYLSSAKEMLSCLRDIPAYQLDESQQEESLQLLAMASLNYLKGGNVEKADSIRQSMVSRFPGQDLYFSDYTSFNDTLTALISGHTLSSKELSSLNISRQVREEVERQQYWLTH